MLFNKEDTEEIVQDTLLAALQGLRKFNRNSSLKTWLYRIALNKAKDHIRYKKRKKRNKSAEDESAFPTMDEEHPGVKLESKEEMMMLKKGIDQLPEKQRLAIILSKFDHKTHKEIAEILKVTEKAVEALIYRGKSNFRTYLESQQT